MLDNLTLAKHYFSELSEEQKRVFLREMNLTTKAKPKAKYQRKKLPPGYEVEDFIVRIKEGWPDFVERNQEKLKRIKAKKEELERKKANVTFKRLLKDTGIEMN